jgi:magnesium-transporting ATPase (P-type)
VQDKTLSENFKYLLASAVALNSDANPKVKRGGFEQVGNKTECALLEMIYNYGHDYRDIRKSEQVLNTVPFSSDRKRMSTICRLNKNGKYYIVSKGAPEILVNYCSKFLDKNNEVSAINERYKAELEETITKFASQSLRTILLCYQELPNKEIASTPDPEKLEKDLIILGLAGIKDPLKDSVPEAVLNCKKAGIIVRMVTGDNTETATAIAKDAHIISSDYVRPQKGEPGYYIVMEGREFRTLVEGLVKKN